MTHIGKIYISGGFNGWECVNTAEVYDPETNQWTMIAPMRKRRSGLCCVAYHGSIYVIGIHILVVEEFLFILDIIKYTINQGGYNGISRLCCGEKFSPETNTWTRIPKMYYPRSNFAIAIIDDMIFAIGGYNGVYTMYNVECYDEKTNEW